MLQLRSVTTGYHKKNPLLRDFTYDFDSKIYGILSPSGTGKTTLLRTVAKLIKPLSGEILIDGKAVKSSRSSDIYLMHQNYTNFDWLTCFENVLIAKKIKGKVTKEDMAAADKILKDVGLGEYSKSYPGELSGGMKQRLALARTIFVKPKIILMDEPLSALDEETRSNMQSMILNLHKQTNNTILLVTHSKTEASIMCDHILNLQ